MSFSLTAFHHAEWQRHGLQDFSEFADRITECNVGEDAFSGFGEWFYIPDEPLPNGDWVIYHGSWSNDNSAGASMHTSAEIFDGSDFDELAEFTLLCKHWEAMPEYVDCDYGNDDSCQDDD